MTPGVITFYWGVRGEVKHLGHHTIFLPNDYRAAFADLMKHRRIPRGLPFYVSVPSATDAALAPRGDTTMFVLVPVPLLSELPSVDWKEAAREVKARVLGTLAHHGIELDAERIGFEEIYTPVEWRRRFGLYEGSAFGAAHNLFQVGPFRRKNFSAEIEGLYYVGASTTPGRGCRWLCSAAGRSRRGFLSMYVERYGAGAEVYFGLHGWSGDHRTFAPLAAHMPPGASLYSADLPGVGNSIAPPDLNLRAVVDEIVEALSEIAPSHKRVTLIGNCSGAILSLLAAQRVPERIAKLILIDPFAYWPWYFRVFVAGSFGRYAYLTTFANPLGRWLTNQSLKGRRTAHTDLTNSFSRIDHDVTHRYLALLSEVDGMETFRNLRMPIEIVYGERTFGAVKKSIAMWQGIWPQARARQLAGAGHLPILEATRQLSEIVFAGAEAQNVAPLRDRESEVRI
jgi:pimeloyl-ACP methyl ester carboxylesterase